MAEGRLRQGPVRGGGHVHPHALHLQKGEELLHAGLRLDLLTVELVDLIEHQAHQLVHRLGELVVVLAVGHTVPEGEGLQLLLQLRRRLNAQLPQHGGPQPLPDGHGVQQGAVHIKNRALQSHGNSFPLLPTGSIVMRTEQAARFLSGFAQNLHRLLMWCAASRDIRIVTRRDFIKTVQKAVLMKLRGSRRAKNRAAVFQQTYCSTGAAGCAIITR